MPREKHDITVPRKALEEMMVGDVLDSAELSKFPVIKDLEPRIQAQLCAYACGYGTPFIAKMFGISQPAVVKTLNRYDPERMFKIGPDAKKAFITRIVESRMAEAITSITPEKFEASTAKELTGIAKDLATIQANMNQSKHKNVDQGRLASLLEASERERVEKLGSAEVEEQ